MGKPNEHIENVQKIEDELRKLAVPYSSEEPGPLYWANFRVRVMERIAEEEKSSLLNKIGGWFGEHKWQSGIAISAAAALVIGVVLIHPFSGIESVNSSPVATVSVPPAPTATAPHSEQPVLPQASVSTSVERDMAAEAQPVHAVHSDRVSAEPKEDLALASEPVSDASDHGVSLQELSQPELEAVLHDLQSNE